MCLQDEGPPNSQIGAIIVNDKQGKNLESVKHTSFSYSTGEFNLYFACIVIETWELRHSVVS